MAEGKDTNTGERTKHLINFYIFTKINKLEENINIDHEFHKKVMKYIEETEHEYFSTHTKICFFIIHRIYRRVLLGYGSKFGGIKIDTTNKLIIDGNHRYIAFKLANFNFETIEWTKNHSDPLNKINSINLVISEDWDMNCPTNKKYCTDEFLADL